MSAYGSRDGSLLDDNVDASYIPYERSSLLDNSSSSNNKQTSQGSSILWKIICSILVLFAFLVIVGSLIVPIILRAKCKRMSQQTSSMIATNETHSTAHIQIHTIGHLNIAPQIMKDNFFEGNDTKTGDYAYQTKRKSVTRSARGDFQTFIQKNGTVLSVSSVDTVGKRTLACKSFESTLFVPTGDVSSEGVSLDVQFHKNSTAVPQLTIARDVTFMHIDTNSLNGNTNVVLNVEAYAGANIVLHTVSGTFNVASNGNIDIITQTSTKIEAVVVGKPPVVVQTITLRSTSGNIAITAN